MAVTYRVPRSQVGLLGTAGIGRGGGSTKKHDVPVPLTLGSREEVPPEPPWLPQPASGLHLCQHRETATRHSTQHPGGVVDWLTSVFSQPPVLRQPASARHQCRRPQITARRKDGSSEREDCVCTCPRSGRGPARPQTLGALPRTGAGICPLPGHPGCPSLPTRQQGGLEEDCLAVEGQGHKEPGPGVPVLSHSFPCAISL